MKQPKSLQSFEFTVSVINTGNYIFQFFSFCFLFNSPVSFCDFEFKVNNGFVRFAICFSVDLSRTRSRLSILQSSLAITKYCHGSKNFTSLYPLKLYHVITNPLHGSHEARYSAVLLYYMRSLQAYRIHI